jgi:hypothetical protein
MAIITTITPMIQKMLFMLHPSVKVMPRSAVGVSNGRPARKVPVAPLFARFRGIPAPTRLRWRDRGAEAQSDDGAPAGSAGSRRPSRAYRSTPASIALCSDRATLRALALAYRQERLRGRPDAAAREAAIAVFLRRHPKATRATAAEAVALMLVVAAAPDPERATLRAVALAYREARHGGAAAPAAYEAAVDAYLELHPETPPLAAYGAVARMLAVAMERSPRWFWRGLAAPRGNDL